MSLEDMINLERVQIVEETAEHYSVKYNGEEHLIAKSNETSFRMGQTSGGTGCAMSLQQTLRLSEDTTILQDESAPREFKEVMMFHELREIEYQNAGFKDAHSRAVNDELLYALKFFDEKTRESYFVFAKDARSKLKVPKKTPKNMVGTYIDILRIVGFHSGWKQVYKRTEEELGDRIVSPEDFGKIQLLVRYQDGIHRPLIGRNDSLLEGLNVSESDTRFLISDAIQPFPTFQHVFPPLISAFINRIPEAEGHIEFNIPESYIGNPRINLDGDNVQREFIDAGLKRKNVSFKYNHQEVVVF